MAHMYPKQLNPDTNSDAEKLLYRAFADQLGNAFTVFHSVAWLGLDAHRRRRDGEADFVIAHATLGILILEVKGGTPYYDPATGQWTSTSKSGITNDTSDPFAQGRQAQGTLLPQIKNRMRSPNRFVLIGHAVGFPDVAVNTALPGLDKSRQIILDVSDLSDLTAWVTRTLDYWRGQGPATDPAAQAEALDIVIDLLAKPTALRPAMWGNLLGESLELLELTKEQYRVLDGLSRYHRAAICGCAGSGKTMLAVEKADRLAKAGFAVLFTCFNEPLAVDLRQRLPGRTFDIVHFHGLPRFLTKTPATPPTERTQSDFFKRILPNQVMTAVDATKRKYDAIIVDEAQDFDANWWMPLQYLLRDPDNGILYIFYDDNQRLYQTSSAFPVTDPTFQLTTNCRNTQAIHAIVAQFYDGQIQPSPSTAAGRDVEIISYARPDDLRATAQAVLRRLTQEDKVPADEIALLTPLSPDKSALWQPGLPGKPSPDPRPRLTQFWPPPLNQVYCNTIHSFKGLESSIIILAELERWPDFAANLDHLLYVGTSRARNHLIVLLPDYAPAQLKAYFAKKKALTTPPTQ